MKYVDVIDVRSELKAFGYSPNDDDDIMIRGAIDRVIAKVKSFTNLRRLPDKLKPTVISMACGEFLYVKKITGGLREGAYGSVSGSLKFRDRVTQWTEGDSSVSLTAAGKDDEANFDKFIDNLRKGDYRILEHFRVLDWR